MKPVQRSRADRRERRRQIAAAVQAGADRRGAAILFDVSASTVRRACREFKVGRERRSARSSSTLRLIAAVQAGDKPIAQIARDHGVSRQYLYRVIEQANEAGVRLAAASEENGESLPTCSGDARLRSGGPAFEPRELAENVRHHAGLIAIRASSLTAEQDVAAAAETEIWRLLVRCRFVPDNSSGQTAPHRSAHPTNTQRGASPSGSRGQRGAHHADTQVRRRRSDFDRRSDSHRDQASPARPGDAGYRRSAR